MEATEFKVGGYAICAFAYPRRHLRRRWTGLGACHLMVSPSRRLPSESTNTICQTLVAVIGVICSSSFSRRRI